MKLFFVKVEVLVCRDEQVLRRNMVWLFPGDVKPIRNKRSGDMIGVDIEFLGRELLSQWVFLLRKVSYHDYQCEFGKG